MVVMDLDAIRARDAAADRCMTCGRKAYTSDLDDPYHLLTVEECTRARGDRGPCADPSVHHRYVPGGVEDDPWSDGKSAVDRRALLAEVDRLTQEVAHLNYRLASPFTTWRGICGHLWDRAVENTDECPRCAMEARLPKAIADGIHDAYAHSAQDERVRIAAEVRGLPRYSPDLNGTVLFGKRRPSVHTDVDGSFVDRAAVLAAIDGGEK